MRIHRNFMLAALVATAAFAGVATASAQDASSAFVKVSSHEGFTATVSQLKQAVASNHLMVMGHIDQAKVLSMTGLHLEGAQSFLVGNPNMGKKAFGMNPAAGAVLPARIYVWSDHGKAYIGYFKPSAQLSAISPGFAMMGGMLDKKFHMLTEQAAR
ncbi:DUF302 domain-containing protein [Oleiagrimonas sp.]|uniref:DUF302 domain-containing protein n=1 Tax=Oleiagrimonas sp. TaxID=2010330 RepID=UPI002639F24E|nr:DUF302 domain-containing protein [Oleiagrimonas sp.]MDA3914064.1 DUF302 domain-containing protein [Oleiagrimonas sp.]